MSGIIYHPPKKVSFAHGPRARSARKAWLAVQTFLNEHTSSTVLTSLHMSMRGANEWTDADVAEAARSHVEQAFGPPSESEASSLFANWDLPLESLDKALEVALSQDQWPKQQLGPLHMSLSYSFNWRNLPGYDPADRSTPFAKLARNSLGIGILGRRLYIQPRFVFNASEENKTFVARLLEFEAALPFKANELYYRRLDPTKDGKGAKRTKLPAGWRSLDAHQQPGSI